jgi:UDP-N-acetylglucosamine diphosphorylase/glucosamine-1-phosphate N-acetyltransferase
VARKGAQLVGGEGIFAGAGTVIKPGVVIDAGNGPVLLGEGVTVMPNAVIIGPAVIGSGALVKAGAKVYGGTTIGAGSKAGGEIEASVMLPFVNKQHEGFLGHSYLASWVNLGADTNTSDLKNTYGSVSVLRRGKKIDTGMQFLGLTMGDHSKSGINVMFDTGTVAGVCCNVFGAGIPPKEIPSFTWSGPAGQAVYDPAKGFEVMKIVMARRGVVPSPEYGRTVREVFDRTASDREIAGVR